MESATSPEIKATCATGTFVCCCFYFFVFVFWWHVGSEKGFPGGSVVKESACQCRRRQFDPWVGKIPWRKKWQPTPVFCLENTRQRSLAGYSPCSCKRVRLSTHTHVIAPNTLRRRKQSRVTVCYILEHPDVS